MRYCLTFVASVVIWVILTLPEPSAKPVKVKATRQVKQIQAEPRDVPPLLRTPQAPHTLLHDPTHTRSTSLEGRLLTLAPVPDPPHGPGLVIPDEAGTARLTLPTTGASAWDWPELVFPEEEPEVVPPARHPKLPIQ